MDRVHSVCDQSVDQIEFAGVLISTVDVDQRHLGMLHRDSEQNSVLRLDLAWHYRLRNDRPHGDFLWIDPPISRRRLRQVAAICRKIWRANQRGIPYAFSPPNDCFDAKTGEFLLGPTSLGLTCATFVLAVFHVAGLQLVEYESWPTGRAGDEQWQQKIVSALEDHGAAGAHCDLVRNEIGSARFRPEEVAGAATAHPWPIEFARAAELGQEILKRL